MLLEDSIGAFFIKKKKRVVIWRNFGRIPNLGFNKKGQSFLTMPLVVVFLGFFILTLYAFKGPIIEVMNFYVNMSNVPPFSKFLLVFGLPFVMLIGTVIWFFTSMRGGTTG
jgi:hypothetical protein